MFLSTIFTLRRCSFLTSSLNLEDMVIATPDVGGAKRANSYAKYLDVPLVLCHKQRAKANVVAKMTVIGDVKDKNVILVDDMVDTAGTITKAANLMLENGAKSVRALASHAIMSDRYRACSELWTYRDYFHQLDSLHSRVQQVHDYFGSASVCRHYQSCSFKPLDIVAVSYQINS